MPLLTGVFALLVVVFGILGLTGIIPEGPIVNVVRVLFIIFIILFGVCFVILERRWIAEIAEDVMDVTLIAEDPPRKR